jgi:hypothetical protein
MPNSMEIFISTGHPWHPPVTRVIAHEKPDQRTSWDPHGVDGYYLGPALDHYRCYHVHIKTKGTRIFDTLRAPSKDLAVIATLEPSNALQNPAPAAPFSLIGTAQIQALCQFSEIFSEALPSKTTHHAPPMSQAS